RGGSRDEKLVALTGNRFVSTTVSRLGSRPRGSQGRRQRNRARQYPPGSREGREHASGGPARLLGFRRWRARSGGQHGRWRRAADRGDRAGKPVLGGTEFGAVGPYERLHGTIFGELDPTHPLNVGIVNLDRAARNAHGNVEYQSDFRILKPLDLDLG